MEQSLSLRCGKTLPNRICKAAMTEQLVSPSREAGSDGGAPTKDLINLYKAYGAKDAKLAMCITGNVMVDHRYCEATRNVVLEDDTFLDRFKEWSSVFKYGLSVMQISHPGRQCPGSVTTTPVGPSDVQLVLPGPAFVSKLLTCKPQTLTTDEVKAVVTRFAKSAELAVKAGFDGVEVHAAHGYLLNQFMNPRVNCRRSDEYSGESLDNRTRLLFEVLEAVRKAVGTKHIVGVKLNSCDFQKGGMTEEEMVQVLEKLDKKKVVDFVEISGGTYEAPVMMTGFSQRESTKQREVFFLDFAKLVRKHVKNTPIMLTGGFRTPSVMNDAVKNGDVDLIGAGRQFAMNADFAALAIDALSSPEKRDVPVADYELPLPIKSKAVRDLTEAVLANLWHQAQMYRISQGQPTNLKLSPWPILGYPTLRTYVWDPYRYPTTLRAVVFAVAVSVLSVAYLWVT